jgi:EAL domain-containing protein (putative c-di-GMP-specific phosphodiesterase class I)
MSKPIIPLILHIGVVPCTTQDDIETALEQARFTALSIREFEESHIQKFSFKEYTQVKTLETRAQQIKVIIEHNDMYPVYQPIITCITGDLYGYEGLTRCTNPLFTNLEDVLNDADIVGLYPNLEIAMTYNAIRGFQRQQRGTQYRLFLNMAPSSIKTKLYNDDIFLGLFAGTSYVIEIIERGEVKPEIILMLEQAIQGLDALVALDDFGTGYSNHLALLNTKPNIVKVSRELLSGINIDMNKQHAYSNIVQFVHNMGSQVLAEGIETPEEFDVLLRLGMDYAQGYYIGHPQIELSLPNPDIKSKIQRYQEFQLMLKSQGYDVT